MVWIQTPPPPLPPGRWALAAAGPAPATKALPHAANTSETEATANRRRIERMVHPPFHGGGLPGSRLPRIYNAAGARTLRGGGQEPPALPGPGVGEGPAGVTVIVPVICGW